MSGGGRCSARGGWRRGGSRGHLGVTWGSPGANVHIPTCSGGEARRSCVCARALELNTRIGRHKVSYEKGGISLFCFSLQQAGYLRKTAKLSPGAVAILFVISRYRQPGEITTPVLVRGRVRLG